MATVPTGLGTVVPTATSIYRITSPTFHTAGAKHYAKVVNGEGAVRSRHGARYNHPGARAVYLTEPRSPRSPRSGSTSIAKC